MVDERTFQVIAATDHGTIVECDVVAVDAPSATVLVAEQLRTDEPEAVVTQVHARRVGEV